MRQMALILTVPLKGMVISSSGSSSLLCRGRSGSCVRCAQGLNMLRALPASASLRQVTCMAGKAGWTWLGETHR